MSRSSSRAIFSFGILTLAAALATACASQSQPAAAGDASTSTTETNSAAQPTTPTEAATGSTTPGTTTPGTTTPGTTGTTGTGNPDKEPNREYRIRDSAQCKAALFQCPTGSKAFTNECGCGCEKP